MQPFATDILSNLENYHTEIEGIIDGLPQAALDWSPGPDTNSIAVLVVHLTGAERYYLSDVIAGESSNRDRPAEFQTRGPPLTPAASWKGWRSTTWKRRVSCRVTAASAAWGPAC